MLPSGHVNELLDVVSDVLEGAGATGWGITPGLGMLIVGEGVFDGELLVLDGGLSLLTLDADGVLASR